MLLRRYNSYAEKSISGNGIHIYGICDLSRLPTYIDEKGRLRLARDFYMRSPDDLELYIGGITNRFAVYTGDEVNDCDICDCTEVVLTTLDKEMRRKPKTKYSESRDESENTPVPHGAFGHRCDHEHIYASGTGGCQRRDDPYGRIKRSQARTGKGNWRKNDYSKDVLGGVIWRKIKDALLTVKVGRAFFLWRIVDGYDKMIIV